MNSLDFARLAYADIHTNDERRRRLYGPVIGVVGERLLVAVGLVRSSKDGDVARFLLASLVEGGTEGSEHTNSSMRAITTKDFDLRGHDSGRGESWLARALVKTGEMVQSYGQATVDMLYGNALQARSPVPENLQLIFVEPGSGFEFGSGSTLNDLPVRLIHNLVSAR